MVKESAVNIVDPQDEGDMTSIDLEGQDTLTFPSEFPAGEIQDEKHTGPEFDQFKRPRSAEIGQELNELTTERETSKPNQQLSQHGLWNKSYTDYNKFEDPDLKLGETDDNDSLSEPVYEPYSQAQGPFSRYEDANKRKHKITLYASDNPNNGPKEFWIAVDLDGTILSSPDEYQDEAGNQVFGEPLPGAINALQELINGGARVSVYTARQYFADDEQDLIQQVEDYLTQVGVPFSDVYVGKKPPAHHFIDDRTIPPFEGDWEVVLDTVRDRLEKRADDQVKDQKDYHGIKIDVEWPKGSIRSYDGDDTYVTHMKCDYGYARDVDGADGDCLDIYLGEADSDTVYIIEQVKDDGSYDEDKIMLGFSSEDEAIEMFCQHMPEYMFGEIREVPLDKFVNALYKGPEDRRGEEDLIPSEEKDGPGSLITEDQARARAREEISKSAQKEFNNPSEAIKSVYPDWDGNIYRAGNVGQGITYFHTSDEGAEFYVEEGREVEQHTAPTSGKTILLDIDEDFEYIDQLHIEATGTPFDEVGDIALVLEDIMPSLKQMGYEWAVIFGETGSDVSGYPVELVKLAKDVFKPKIKKRTKSDYVGPQTSQVGGIGGPVGDVEADSDTNNPIQYFTEFLRSLDNETLLIVLNSGNEPVDAYTARVILNPEETFNKQAIPFRTANNFITALMNICDRLSNIQMNVEDGEKVSSKSMILYNAMKERNFEPYAVWKPLYEIDRNDPEDIIKVFAPYGAQELDLYVGVGNAPGTGYSGIYSEGLTVEQIEELRSGMSDKESTKTWPGESDAGENEWTDPVETRENRDIPRR